MYHGTLWRRSVENLSKAPSTPMCFRISFYVTHWKLCVHTRFHSIFLRSHQNVKIRSHWWATTRKHYNSHLRIRQLDAPSMFVAFPASAIFKSNLQQSKKKKNAWQNPRQNQPIPRRPLANQISCYDLPLNASSGWAINDWKECFLRQVLRLKAKKAVERPLCLRYCLPFQGEWTGFHVIWIIIYR